MPPWVERLRRSMARVGDRGVVAAVSGGADSVAMLRALHAVGARRLSVAHLDHNARGEESAADARFVAALAESLGLPLDLGAWSPTRAAHFEADARQARYAWLAEVAKSRQAAFVAAGHTRDDQAETILFRILRGTGPSGLAGIPRTRRLDDSVVLIRPLLHVSRFDLRTYLQSLGQSHREDDSNADLSRSRSRIRHDLLPRLAAQYNPRVAEALVRLGGLAAEAERAWARGWGRLERLSVLRADGDGIILRRDVFEALPRHVRVEVLRRAWRRLGWPEQGVDEARWRRLVRRPRGRVARVDIGGGVTIDWDFFGGIQVHPPGRPPSAPLYRPPPIRDPKPLRIPGTTRWGDGLLRAVLDPGPGEVCEVVVDLDALALPLRIAQPAEFGRPQDRFDPLGMGGHTQTLTDFLRGRRIPTGERRWVPLVRDEQGIAWVVGHRIAHRVRRTGATTRTLGLSWTPPAGPACR